MPQKAIDMPGHRQNILNIYDLGQGIAGRKMPAIEQYETKYPVQDMS